jgi:nucleoside-diphosphate-sugar epimerase
MDAQILRYRDRVEGLPDELRLASFPETSASTGPHSRAEEAQSQGRQKSECVNVRIFLTGGSGVLGRAAVPLLQADGHDVVAPLHTELDLFDSIAVASALSEADAVLHLATRIPPHTRIPDPEAWHENDRLRGEASKLLVDAALAGRIGVFVQPTVTFVYPDEGFVDETTPVEEVPDFLRSALSAEAETARFAAECRRGVVLRFGLLDGPGSGNLGPDARFGATLHVTDAGRALVAALVVPSGVYNVCRDGERVSNARFGLASGWHPER